jgi:hypothetical protein
MSRCQCEVIEVNTHVLDVHHLLVNIARGVLLGAKLGSQSRDWQRQQRGGELHDVDRAESRQVDEQE